MRKLKGFLAAAGMMLIFAAMTIQELPEEPQTLWEKIPDEEISNDFKEEEQTEDLAVNELIPHIRYEEVKQSEEELSQGRRVNEFSLAEARLLMKVAQAEAGNQGTDGMWLVMSVILNRTESPDYPDTVTEVIYQPHQFSSVANGSFEDQAIIKAETHRALARIETGDVADEILAFETTKSTELDKYFTEAFTYRDHKFYTSK